MQWNRLVVNLWSKMSLFCSMKEGVSYLFLSATTYLLFCHVQPPPRSAVPHVCCRPSNGRKMQALTAVEWLTAVRYETDGRLANGWTDGLPENRLTGLGAGLPLTLALLVRFPILAPLKLAGDLIRGLVPGLLDICRLDRVDCALEMRGLLWFPESCGLFECAW